MSEPATPTGSRPTNNLIAEVTLNEQGINKRTRHKKVNYLEMLKGEEKEKEKSSEDSIRETIEAVAKSSPDLIESCKVSRDKSSIKQSHSKKKSKRNESCDNKSKDALNQKKKLIDLKKKGKGHEKGGTSTKEKQGINNNKAKGSTLKILKKCDKKAVGKSEEQISDPHEQEFDSHANKKFKPLKLKVNSLLNFASQRKLVTSPSKKGLFSRSNSTSSTSDMDRPLRVLAVAHQPAFGSEDMESHLPSQPADIHLDLFTKSSSACVQCHTCSQFLSVPHFMRHHHVPMDSEWLATESTQRILVPRNKENISEWERKLWEEFHRLQEAIGGFGEGDDDSDGEEDEDDDGESIEEADEQMEDNDNFVNNSEREHTNSSFHVNDSVSFILAGHNHGVIQSLPSIDEGKGRAKSSPTHLVHPSPKLHQAESLKVGTNSTKVSTIKNPTLTSPTVSTSVDRIHGQDSGLHVRTSSRKRKSKQLFSIENY